MDILWIVTFVKWGQKSALLSEGLQEHLLDKKTTGSETQKSKFPEVWDNRSWGEWNWHGLGICELVSEHDLLPWEKNTGLQMEVAGIHFLGRVTSVPTWGLCPRGSDSSITGNIWVAVFSALYIYRYKFSYHSLPLGWWISSYTTRNFE